MANRRVRILRISRELFAGLFRQDCDRQIVFDGMPADAKIVGVSEHVFFEQDQIAIKIESETFAEVAPGKAIPEIKNITVTEVRPEARRVYKEQPCTPTN